MGNSKSGNNALAALERERQALQLRKGGATFEAIAAHLGYHNHSGAYKAVRRAMRRTLQEPANELRRLELARLDDLLRGVWVAACQGNVAAVDRVLKIMARRAALLGLDAPQAFKDATDPRREAAAIAAEIGRPELVEQIHRDLLLRQVARQ